MNEERELTQQETWERFFKGLHLLMAGGVDLDRIIEEVSKHYSITKVHKPLCNN